MAEQFAIAEAKLRAWASMDDDDEEDSNDEDSLNGGHTHTSLSQSSGMQPFCSSPSQFSHCLFFFASSLKNRLISPPVRPPLLYPSTPRCSDFLLLPQTLPHPILSQKRNASLRLMVTRLRPLTVPWAPAAAACPVVRLLLIMTPIQPRLIHPFYPSTT